MSELPSPKAIQEAIAMERQRVNTLSALLKAVQSASPKGIQQALERLAEQPTAEVGPIVAASQGWLEEEERQRRSRFAAELKSLCAADGVELNVLSRDPLELRLPPVSVKVDFEDNTTEILFATLVLARTEVAADKVMEARAKAVKNLDGKVWDPDAWLATLYRAWRRVVGSRDDWVEFSQVLPELALLLQPRKFRRDPSTRNYAPYPKVQLAYDLWRLRRDRTLTTDGWRLNLGTATGSSTKDKGRVLKLEDDKGDGQYHLTLRFTREEI